MSDIPIYTESDLQSLIKIALEQQKKELETPSVLKMIIDLPNVSVSKKPRKDGRYQGYAVGSDKKHYFYGVSREEVAVKIKNALKKGFPPTKARKSINKIPQTFDAFSMYYFNKFRSRKVSEATLKVDLRRYDKYLKPTFGEMPIKKITPAMCQDLLDEIIKKGKGKTADEIYSLLSVIFKTAIQHGIIARSPLNTIFHQKHERKHGSALTEDEIIKLKTALQGTKSESAVNLMLYTGLRPNEIYTASIDDNFIIANNSKRKNGKKEIKKIPIIDELRPYLNNFDFPTIEKLETAIKKTLPNHRLYDLRTTFYSKCKECGVELPALMEFVGHSLGALGNAYTDLSDNYLLKEGKKIKF